MNISKLNITAITIPYIVILMVFMNYTYWSQFHIPIDSFTDLNSLLSSSFEVLVLIISPAFSIGVLLYILLVISDKIQTKYNNKVAHKFNLIFLPVSIIPAFLLITRYYHLEPLIIPAISLLSFSCSTALYVFSEKYFFQENTSDSLDGTLSVRVKIVLSFTLAMMFYLSYEIPRLKALNIKNECFFHYYEDFDKNKVKYLGKMGGNFIFMSGKTIIYKDKLKKLKIYKSTSC